MSLLILGDVHLGKGQNIAKHNVGSAINSRVLDQLNLLDWVYDKAVEHNIEHLVLTGDVFEEPKPHYSLVIAFVDWLRKCVSYNINVHIIAGNHDILRSGQYTSSPLDILSGMELEKVFFYKKIDTIQLENIGLTLLPFRDRRSFNTDSNSEALSILKKQLPYEVASIDDDSLKILIGHLAIKGGIPIGYELDELANELICPLDMFSDYDYVWMGHIHKFQRLSENPCIEHIGSMDISDFGESEERKFIVLIKPKAENKIEYIQIPTRPLRHIKITLPVDIDDANTFIQQELAKRQQLDKAIIKLTIFVQDSNRPAIDRTAIEDFLYKMKAFYVAKISEERNFTSLKKQNVERLDNTVNEQSAIKTYSQLIDERLRTDFVSTALNVIQEYKENIK